MRFVYAAALLAGLGIGGAAAQDNGERLFQNFEKTCAAAPATAAALDASASGLGYVHQNGPVAPDDPARALDDLHYWKLPDQGSAFIIEAYFAGPRAAYEVNCSIHVTDVDAAALIDRINRAMNPPVPKETETDADTGRVSTIWRGETNGAESALVVSAYKNGRVNITLGYHVIAK